MGDSPPNVGQSTGDLIRALAQYAPQAIQALNTQAVPTAQSQLAADIAVAPGYNRLYDTGQMQAAQTEANIAAGPGQQMVKSADVAQRTLDPEYYQSRALLNEGLGKYLGSYSPTELTPTELAQISRGINATTGPLTESNLNTIKNAQTFGNAATQRWQNFGNALAQVSSAMPALRSGLPGFQIATQRGNNPGGTFPQTGANVTSANFGFANNAMSNIGANQRQLYDIRNQNSPINLGLKGSQMFGNVVGAL